MGDGVSNIDKTCVLCSKKFNNQSFLDNEFCRHTFCFDCIKEWSTSSTQCPVCQNTFKFIIHNVRSRKSYDIYDVSSRKIRDCEQQRNNDSASTSRVSSQEQGRDKNTDLELTQWEKEILNKQMEEINARKIGDNLILTEEEIRIINEQIEEENKHKHGFTGSLSDDEIEIIENQIKEIDAEKKTRWWVKRIPNSVMFILGWVVRFMPASILCSSLVGFIAFVVFGKSDYLKNLRNESAT